MEETSSPAAPAPPVEAQAPTSVLSVLTTGTPDIPVDPAVRFRGLGTNFKGKLIGIDDVPDSRGDDMCQGSLIKLKAAVLASGRHKQKVVINVSLEGIKIVDILTGEVQHVHPVHRISFIARDLTDRRAFGYVYGAGEGKHQFFGIKTMKVAEVLVLALRDLFQVVFDMKKKEIEEVKNPQTNGEEVNEQKQEDVVYAVPNKQKAQQPQQPQKEGNLFDLEQQLTTIQEGINNIDSIGPWSQDTPTSPDTPGFGGDNNGGDLFGIASNTSNGMSQKTSSYSDELFDLASPVAQPVPQPGAKLTKEQILSSFGGAPQGGMFPGQTGMMPGQQGMMPGQQGMMPGQAGMMPGQQGMMPGQPGMMRAQFGQGYQQQMGMPQSTPAMNMFPQGPSPAIPPRPGAMRPAAPQALSGGAQQNPFGDAVGADGIMMPMSNTVTQSTEKAEKSDPFANLTLIGGSGAANKKDMFKNFQMAKAPQPPPRTNPPVSSPGAVAAPAEQSSDFENYFLSSVGGVPVTDDGNPVPAPRQQAAANDPFGMGLGGSNPPAATTTSSLDPFASNQGFSQPFEFN